MVVTEFHRSVDVLRARYSLLKHSHRFESKHHAQTTRSKAGNVFDDDRLFPKPPSYRRGDVDSRGAGLFANNDFKQSHDMHGIEKVHTDNGFGTFRRTGYLSNGQRRRIASE